MHMDARSQLIEVDSLFTSWVLETQLQAWQQASLSTESSQPPQTDTLVRNIAIV